MVSNRLCVTWLVYCTILYYTITLENTANHNTGAMVCLMALHPIFPSCHCVFFRGMVQNSYSFSILFHGILIKPLTECEGRTGEYWSEVVTVWIKHSKVYIKTTKGHQYFSVQLKQTRLVSVIWLYQLS